MFNINSTDDEHLKKIKDKMNWGRLILLAVLSLILCSFGPLSLFAAVPLTMAFLIYGYQKSIAVLLTFSVVLSVLVVKSTSSKEWLYIAGVFIFANILALIISKIVIKNIHPMRGLIQYGGLAIVLIFLTLGYLLTTTSEPIGITVENIVSKNFEAVKQHPNYKMVINAGGQDARNLKDLIDHPEMVTKEILNWSISSIFVSIFFVLWLNMFMVLKNNLLWKELHGFQFETKDLTRFQIPDFLSWILILALTLVLAGEYLLGAVGPVVGMNLIYCLGIFYFFSGFGLYLDFLDSIKIRGFFRSIFIVVTVFVAFKMLALIGVLDTWVNFRRFMKKKENEGDII